MAIITFTSDLGLKDYYVSAVKGAIHSQLQGATIVDVSHLIPTYNLLEAAYILKNAYTNFPKGTIHIVSVMAGASQDNKYVVISYKGHYFIGTDNGLFSLMFDDIPEKIIELNTAGKIFTFPSRDVFAKAACFLAEGGNIDNMGTVRTELYQRLAFKATSMNDLIKGNFVYFDSFGNAITNIDKTLFDQSLKGRSFEILFNNYRINRISTSYLDVREGDVLAIFNASGQLEIAMNQGNAKELCGIRPNNSITIQIL
ncbi:MAG: SAM-dependent chlorinase/fluorinase [Bacteroidia bacterium]|nr:SAM-dependent chlorinase/fluorinase [Bacteroidia bacterium]